MHQLKSKARISLPKIRTLNGHKEEHKNERTRSTTATNNNKPFHLLARLKCKFQAKKRPGTKEKKKPRRLAHSASQLRKVFTRYDDGGDGRVDPADLGQMMRALGGNPTQAEVDRILSKEKLNGPFGFEKFAQLMGRHLKSRDDVSRAKKVQRAFEVMDRDAEGYVSISDLKLLLTTSGERLDPDEFDEWIGEIGVSPDGKVRYEDVIVTL